MLRIRFTSEDLMRVRIAQHPAPLMELGLMIAVLQRRDEPDLTRAWRRRRSLASSPEAARLARLVPPSGAGPLFLDPLTATVDEGVERVLDSPWALVRTELRRVVPALRPMSPWIRDLERRDRRAWLELGGAVRAGAATLLEPEWDRLTRVWEADAVWRSRRLAEAGVGEALAGVFPGSRWAGSTLEAPLPHDADIALSGRGVTLMPSAVWTGSPLFAVDTDGRTMIVHATRTPMWLAGAGHEGDAIAALLGRSRAAALRTLTRPRTTGQLAEDLGLSAASASGHAATLRGARLITTERHGVRVRHVITPLGLDLLGEGPQP